jgi:outer membrane protein OmpA-like peptidoglycan-associated protein
MSLSSASAQTDPESIQVNGIEVVHADGVVTIAFSLQTGAKVTASNRSLIIDPVLRGAGGELRLAPIIVRGEKANVANVHQAMTAARMDQSLVPYYTTNGKTLDYLAAVPFQNWMRGSELIFNGINAAGKGKATEVNIGLVADNLLTNSQPLPERPLADNRPEQVAQPQAVAPWAVPVDQPQQQPAATIQPPIAPVQYAQGQPQRIETSRTRSIGDELAANFSFVEPVSAFERARRASNQQLFDYGMPLNLGGGAAPTQKQNEVERFVEMTREGALNIQFHQGSHVITRELGNNNRMLVDLISTIRAIEASQDTRISNIIIVGFSSPEGMLNENERLAQERASVAKEFLTANSNVRPDLISVYNGSVDWTSLRELVSKSSMKDKYKILDIIDNIPVWDSSRNRGRLGELMAVNGGDPYRYMLQNFFPQLRQMGAYIKVYYENLY